MTWEQLAEEIKSLTPEQKLQPVRVYEPYDDPAILYPQLLKPHYPPWRNSFMVNSLFYDCPTGC